MPELNEECLALRDELSWEKSARRMSELYSELANR